MNLELERFLEAQTEMLGNLTITESIDVKTLTGICEEYHRLKLKLLGIADVIGSKPTFCKVNANKQQLENIGCDRNLMECSVEYIKDYPTGYSQVKVERKDISMVLGRPIFEFYDIPKIWLEFE